jgi:16S rRNA (adenine1518-N6/adenine1519-N6)-dimethyltransferase
MYLLKFVFTIIDNKDLVAGMIGMFQKEVAQRIAAVPKTKAYGVMSILAQAYYESEYLLDVPPGCFTPPPKVMSGVVALA